MRLRGVFVHTSLHHHLGRRPIDILLEAYVSSAHTPHRVRSGMYLPTTLSRLLSYLANKTRGGKGGCYSRLL
jgi:hypothetical protein